MGRILLHPLSALLVLSLALLSPAISSAQEFGKKPDRDELFYIERNKNANIVQYDAQLGPNGLLSSKQPVVAYWVRLAEQGQVKELNWIQSKFAYGFKANLNKDENTVKLQMVAIPDRTIMVRLVDGDYRAIADINGVECYVDKLFIHAAGEGLSTKVSYIELYGVPVNNNEPQYERFHP